LSSLKLDETKRERSRRMYMSSLIPYGLAEGAPVDRRHVRSFSRLRSRSEEFCRERNHPGGRVGASCFLHAGNS